MKVIIIGAGGHAQVVADILFRGFEAKKDYQPIAFLDDDPALIGKVIMGLPLSGSIGQIGQCEHDAVVVAIGDNRARAGIFKAIRNKGERIISVVHPTAVIASDVRLGQGSMICAGAVVNTGTVIGDGAILNTSCTVDHHNIIEDFAHLAPGVHLGGDVHVGEGTLVGIGSVVIPRCSVGKWAVIGGGAVVIKDIPSYVTAVGVPARIVKRSESEK